MKLLFDQNLSPHLVSRLADLFPGSSHVSVVGLERATDAEVRAYARANDYVIVTKDADFGDLGVVHGFPPTVIWLRLGDRTTQQVAHALRVNHSIVLALSTDPNLGVLTPFSR